MSEFEFDFVVVGAGIVGSWTAKELTKYGKVLLLEQFREPHTRGSSHGQSRLIRSGYEEPFFADLMPQAYKMWRQAEAEMNEKLIETTGVVCIADSADDKGLRDCVNNMKRLCPENLVVLTGKDIKSKYPSTLRYSEETGVMFDKSGGVVFAHKAVRTIQQWFRNSGGIMWDCCKVTKVAPTEKNKVKIVTGKGDVFAKSVVICAGPWTPKLLEELAPSLPLEPQAVKVYYWREKEPGVYGASSGFPAVLELGPPNVYALPSLEYPGLVKVCAHGGLPANPDERDRAFVNPKYENLLKAYIKEHFPLLEAEPAITETCMYTCTPDEVFVIDYLPGHKNIVLGAGFSGTGFKTSPAVGRLLSELAREKEPFLNLAPYRLSRFSSSK